MLLNNQWITEEIKEEIKKCIENHKKDKMKTHRMKEISAKEATYNGLLTKIYKKLMKLFIQKSKQPNPNMCR